MSSDMDQESENGSVNLETFRVHVPQTPMAMDISHSRSTSKRVEDQYASSSMFTGGFNQVTRSQLMDKMIEYDSSHHPQMAGTKGSACEMPGCDGKVMIDERGLEILPCYCDFKICRDCYKDTLRNGELICPGCKVAYVEHGMEEAASAVNQRSKMERRLSRMKSENSTSSTMNELDHDQWLFETKGSYGYGNVMWPKDSENGASSRSGSDSMGGDPNVFKEKEWRPLTRKLNISNTILGPYRYD